MSSWNWLLERKWPIKRRDRTFIPGFYTDLIQPPAYSYHLFYSHNATPLLFCFFGCCVLFSLSFSSPATHSSPPPRGPHVLSFPVSRELPLPIVEFEAFTMWPHPKLGGRLMRSAGFLGGSALKPWQLIGSQSSPVPCDKCYYASWATPSQCLLMHGLKNQSLFECQWYKGTLICINPWYLQSAPNHKRKFTTLNVVYLCI